MAIFPSRTRPIAGNRFPVRQVGTNRQQGATLHPNNVHTAGLLGQAARNGRLNNIGSVQQLLNAHAAVTNARGASSRTTGRK